MSIVTDLVGKEGFKTDVTVRLDNATIINFALAIFIAVIASFYVIKLVGFVTNSK